MLPGCDFTMAKEQDLDLILVQDYVKERRVSPNWQDFQAQKCMEEKRFSNGQVTVYEAVQLIKIPCGKVLHWSIISLGVMYM